MALKQQPFFAYDSVGQAFEQGSVGMTYLCFRWYQLSSLNPSGWGREVQMVFLTFLGRFDVSYELGHLILFMQPFCPTGYSAFFYMAAGFQWIKGIDYKAI